MRFLVKNKGFTLVELLIVCVVIAILATIGLAAYQGVQQRAANAAIFKDLKSASEQLGLSYVRSPDDFSSLDELPSDFEPNDDVKTQLVFGYGGVVYKNLSPVQNGVLFYEVCKELIADPQYSVIHAKDGNETKSVVMSCDDNIGDNILLITGWDSKDWQTNVTRTKIQTYVDSVPYDSWWIDRQDVVRGFYTELMNRFEAKGGTFPITSFWEPDANPWWGIPKEELPAPSPQPAGSKGSYCVQAYHVKFPDTIYKITEDDKVELGSC